MSNSHFSINKKIGLALTGLILWGLLAACGDSTTTNQPGIGGQVPPNTVAPRPTATTTPLPIATVASLPTNTPSPNVTIDTRAAITPWDPNVPYPTWTPFPTGKPAAGDIPNFGTTINVHGKVTNGEAMQKFLDAYAQGKPSQWEYIVYGIDSGPIPQRFVYRGNGRQFTLLTDNTKDGFAAPEDRIIKEYTCQTLTRSAKSLDFGTCVDNKGEKTSGWGLPIA